MQDETNKQQPEETPARKARYVNGAAISVALHLAVLLAIVIGLPHAEPPKPPQEEVVSVDIVPLPEPPKAETPPPPPPPAAEKPPEEKPEEKAPPMPVLNPVFQYGQKDSGAEKSPNGDSAEASADTPEKPKEPAEQQAQTPSPEQEQAPEEAPPVQTEAPPEKQAEKPPETASELTLPELAENGGLKGENDEKPALPPEPPKPDAPKPKQTAPPPMPKAKKLYSSKASGEMVALMAMAGVPREVRISQLCATELREQLKHNSPRYNAEYLPDVELRKGNVMEVPRTAFRASGVWYDLDFRCEVDADATKVLNFSYAVGKRVPKSEWGQRRFPAH